MVGLDLGSRYVKLVHMQKGQIVLKQSWDTIDFYRHWALPGSNRLKLGFTPLSLADEQIVATGYGKMAAQLEGVHSLPEIQAHIKGAIYQTSLMDFTLVDIGGQDTKVVKVRAGKIIDFATNDRCAASSGRYMENMASVLGISLAELSRHSEDPVEINSTCAVFGETEIIARIVEGYSTEQLAAGVNHTLYRRLIPLLTSRQSDALILAGGVAYNRALAQIITDAVGCSLVELPDPQFNGAIGCCVD